MRYTAAIREVLKALQDMSTNYSKCTGLSYAESMALIVDAIMEHGGKKNSRKPKK